MCVYYKVATSSINNRKGNNEEEENREIVWQGDFEAESNMMLESLVSPMFYGFNRQQEMSVMVSALTHVVAGHDFVNQQQQFSEDLSYFSASSSSSSRVGVKRGRDEQDNETRSEKQLLCATGDFGTLGSWPYPHSMANSIMSSPGQARGEGPDYIDENLN